LPIELGAEIQINEPLRVPGKKHRLLLALPICKIIEQFWTFKGLNPELY